MMASWPNDPLVNVPLCNAAGNQGGNTLAVVPSIEGGAIVAWTDQRFVDGDIYAQRINGVGEVQWTVDGVPVCDAADIQMNVLGVSDGQGGAILAWSDMRDGEADVYAQRIDADGNLMWPTGSPSTDGVPVCDTADHQTWVMIVSDGAGGAIVAWEQGVMTSALYAQRLDENGDIQWPENGVVVSDAIGLQTDPRMISDGAGGALLAWTDGRDTANTNFNVYAQRLSASGDTHWAGDLQVCAEDGAQWRPAIAADGAGGMFVAWEDVRSSEDWAIWAQHIGGSGAVYWPAGGIMLADNTMSGQRNLQGAADGLGGAVFVWMDLRNYPVSGRDIYAQRVTAAGAMWPAGGVMLCAAGQNQAAPAIGSPAPGTVLVSWTDYRDDPVRSDLYGLTILDGTTLIGPPHGYEISTAAYSQYGSAVGRMTSGDALIVWQDSRNLATGVDLYAQGGFLTRIFADGFESGDTTAWTSVSP
jgi:hypothetical protein